jgi:hypothetical protein
MEQKFGMQLFSTFEFLFLTFALGVAMYKKFSGYCNPEPILNVYAKF